MAFDSTILRFATAAEYAAYLSAFPAPRWPDGWPIGSTIHNTYKPAEADWRGNASMISMRGTYIAKGWDSGPHVYVAVGSAQAAWDGIWQMTPPIRPGTHAGACNGGRFGIEVVGDFQARHWTTPQRQLLLDTLVALHRWAGIGPDIVGHRDCMAGRTCPGQAAYEDLPQLRADLAGRLTQLRTGTVRGAAVYQQRDGAGPVARYLAPGDLVTIDRDYGDGIVHLADGSGFLRKAETDL